MISRKKSSISQVQSVEKRKIYSSQKIFRQINCLVISVVENVAFTKFLQKCVTVTFRNVQTVTNQTGKQSLKLISHIKGIKVCSTVNKRNFISTK